MGDKRKMKLSGDLDYRIRYDVEHDLFHAQNIFNDEYIPPTFIEYVQRLEKEVVDLQGDREIFLSDFYCDRKGGCKVTELEKENAELKALLNCNNCSELSEEECEVCAEYSHFKCKRKEQLTKAKELLKQWLSLCGFKVEKLAKDTEQFLNSEGK